MIKMSIRKITISKLKVKPFRQARASHCQQCADQLKGKIVLQWEKGADHSQWESDLQWENASQWENGLLWEKGFYSDWESECLFFVVKVVPE